MEKDLPDKCVHSTPASRVLGYTRWNEDVIRIESSEEVVPASAITTTIETSSTFTTSNPPAKIKISLSQTQIACKPPTKPSAIPKRTMPWRPSAALNQSMSLQTQKAPYSSKMSTSDSDSNNEVFAESLPEPKAKNIVTPKASLINPSTACGIPVIEKRNLLRKFSAPTIEVTTAAFGQPNGSPKLGARLAAHASSSVSLVPRNLVGNAKPVNTNQYVDDKHKCAVCTNPFSDPRVLDCLHTFCYACLCNLNPAGVLGLAEATKDEGNGGGDVAHRQRVGEGSDMDLSGNFLSHIF